LADHPNVIINAYFNMEFMNGSAMLDNGFTQYVGIPISSPDWINQTKYNASGPDYRGDVTSKWIEGYTNGYWLPQYHGLTHADTDWILENCTDGNMRTIDAVVNHSCSPVRLTPETRPLDKSEYENNPLLSIELGEANKTEAQCLAHILIGLDEFEDLFGYRSETSTPSGYRCSNETLAAFRQTDVYGINTAPGYGWKATDGSLTDWGWEMFNYFNGLSILGRPMYINGQGLANIPAMVTWLNITFSYGQIAYFEDHKTSYVSGIRDTTVPGQRSIFLDFLDTYLGEIERWYPDAWFLTSPEAHQLNIHGYSIQNWTDKIVVRNALPQRNIDVTMPLGFHVNRLSITNSSSVNMTYTILNGHTVRVNVPHNETFTILKTPLFNYDDQISALLPIFITGTAIVLIMAVISKVVIGPFVRLFKKNF
jgi:hypothetical protein